VACFSRRGLDLLEHAGMAWLREIVWPFNSAIFDGEACAGDGHEGIQAVFTERKRAGGDMALVMFDVLHVGHSSVMHEPWRDRRKRLEDLLDDHQLPGVTVVPVTDDAPTLYETWVGMGGEGIVLKDRASTYRPGQRSPAWLKAKPKVQLKVAVTGGSAHRIAWGGWGEALFLELAYAHPRTAQRIRIRQAVRIARQQPFDLKGRGAGVGRVLGSDAEWDAAAPAVSALGIAGDVLHDRDGASPTSATGTGWERTPWRATQRAAWEALNRAERPSSAT
jgi:hypothetical protein